jgi:hypothetical protein
MHQYILASFLIALPLAVHAEPLVLNDVKAQNGIQLSVDELKQLMPSAKVLSRAETGSTRLWTNEPDGKFVASSDNKASRGRGKSTTAQGTWHVGDNGTYCVTLEWGGSSENWCRYIFKVGAKYYGVSSAISGTAKAHEFEFSK